MTFQYSVYVIANSGEYLVHYCLIMIKKTDIYVNICVLCVKTKGKSSIYTNNWK